MRTQDMWFIIGLILLIVISIKVLEENGSTFYLKKVLDVEKRIEKLEKTGIGN